MPTYCKLMHKRAKPRNGPVPYATDDDFELVVVCTCAENHEELLVEVNQDGKPKEVEGNDACWFGLFEFCTSHLKPTMKLLQNWNHKKRCWGKQNRSTVKNTMQLTLLPSVLVHYASYCYLPSWRGVFAFVDCGVVQILQCRPAGS